MTSSTASTADRARATARLLVQRRRRRGGEAGLAGVWDDLVVVCAGTCWDGVWSSEKHVADRLADYAPVLYVDPPESFITGWRRPEMAQSLLQTRLQLVRPGLARFTPMVVPGMNRLGLPEVEDFSLRRDLRRAVSRLTEHVGAVIVAGQAVPFGACGERLKVLYATDDFVAGAALMGLSERQLRRGQRRHAQQTDIVVAASPVLVDKWRALGRSPVLIPNGCDAKFFAGTDECAPAPDIDLPAPIAGFIGYMSERIDLALLEAVAQRGCSLLLVGPRQPTFDLDRMDSLLALPNVRWVGPKPFQQLPSYLRAIHVGLTPYADTAFNRASFPLKTLEYLASGRAAVATDLPAVRWLDTDLVAVASDPDAFGQAVVTALAQPRTPALAARRRQFASRHSWDARAVTFAKVLGLSGPTSRNR